MLYLLIPMLVSGCVSGKDSSSVAASDAGGDFSEGYEIYPAVTTDGVSSHLVRSHTTAILVRPGSSTYELCNRLIDQLWDVMRRLETRFIRFPILPEESPPGPGGVSMPMDLAEWEGWLDRFCNRKPSSARMDLLIGGEAFFQALEAEVNSAEEAIDLQIYLFDNDDVAAKLAERLKERSKEVRVRIMYDGLGTYLSHFATADSQPEDTEFIDSIPAFLCEDSDIQLRIVPNIWLSGNHCKCIIFDEKTAIIGGMNIGREYRYDWHDMMIRLEGRAVDLLLDDFEKTWRHNSWAGDFAMLLGSGKKEERAELPEEVPVRLLYTYPHRAEIYRAQLEAIRRAGSYIYIENAYFADDRILYELCRASRRGVDVRVIIPAVVNHKVMEHSNKVAINTLLQYGVRVYIYPGMSHIKAAIYDGWVCVGTANFDKLSLQINRELNLASSHPGTAELFLQELFEPDLEKSTELKEPVSLSFKDHLIELIADET